ncbi:MAG: FAD-binding oxidoreductase [Gracilimonas sp.]|uniref:FAD-dependent oxidoreductase n=1 Tax=Gracilimonas sp. TaxID=1974203 RepID=UPI003752802D|nr:FAD-binding oxidoreductase [Gracilimonas sp.]
MKKKQKIAIIGSGVSGLTTAFILYEKGWDVTIISKEDPRTAIMNPEFSSLYPAASIIPHSVYSDDLLEIFRVSDNYFQSLYEESFPGVKLKEHFELFAYKQSLPGYAKFLKNLATWDEFKHGFHPKHPKQDIKSGWKFSGYFADWNVYFPELIGRTLSRRIHFRKKDLQPEDLPSLPYDHIVNCSEIGAVKLFDDKHDLIYRGHILNIKGAPQLLSPRKNPVSYNFSPDPNVYQTESGTRQDVYCYPRKDGWVLGGSRQAGRIDKAGNWQGETVQEPSIIIDSLKVPAQIVEIHADIMKHTFGIDLKKLNPPKAKLGYRYIRKKENGLRLETEEIGDKLFIHNYGHGGAGVTLSWGCALKVAELLGSRL